MAFIEVNHKVLAEAAEAVDTYCNAQDKEMSFAKSAVEAMLSRDWKGREAAEFEKNWSGVDASDSVTVQLRDSLRDFGEALKSCAKEYRTAQEDSYNEASRLLK